MHIAHSLLRNRVELRFFVRCIFSVTGSRKIQRPERPSLTLDRKESLTVEHQGLSGDRDSSVCLV